MIIYLKYDPYAVMEFFLNDMVRSLDIPCDRITAFEIELGLDADKEQIKAISNYLTHFGIEIDKDHKEQLVTQIKSLIVQMINEYNVENTTDYLCSRLHYTYRYISLLFRKHTHFSIESFVIFQKVEKIKSLAIQENLTLTEIAFRMNYCSVAHASRQFKQTTGLTFQEFQKIMAARRRKVKLQN